jgi:hypothetical protein
MSSRSNVLEKPSTLAHPVGATKGPLFLVGIWRSGTSLLYTLMNQHPDIALLYEADLPMLRPLFFVGRKKADWLARWDFWNDSLKRHRIDVDNIEPQSSTVQAATAAAYREFAISRAADVWGEKSPNWFDRLADVAEDFPDARFIAIWRNPADICRSVARAVDQDGWFDKRGMMLRCLLGCESYKLQCDRLMASGIPLHQLRYDDLVRDPERTMQDICRFLDIPFDSRMATLEGADRSTIDQAPQHELVRGNEIVSKKERKEVLSPELKSKIERYMRLWKQKYGDAWLLLRGRNIEPGELPGAWEQFKDRMLYRIFRKFDSMVVMIYSFAPLWLLKAYRASKRSPDVAEAKV